MNNQPDETITVY